MIKMKYKWLWQFFRILLYFILVLLLIFIALYIIRLFGERQIDDVNPFRFCENEYVDKSETLMVIPLFENKSIAENKTWCNYILSLNKTLAMHGVYHSYNEFLEDRDENYIKLGIEEFKKCFGYYPIIFEAPQLALSKNNEKLLRQMGFEVRNYRFNMFHRVYHCVDFERNSYLVGLNKRIDWI